MAIIKQDYGTIGGGQELKYASTSFTGNQNTSVEVLGEVKVAFLEANYNGSYIKEVCSQELYAYSYGNSANTISQTSGLTQVDKTHVKFSMGSSATLSYNLYYWYFE